MIPNLDFLRGKHIKVVLNRNDGAEKNALYGKVLQSYDNIITLKNRDKNSNLIIPIKEIMYIDYFPNETFYP